MAKETPSNPFMDMFQQFGKNLKLPTADVSAVVDYHRKNIQAIQDAASAASAGGQEVMNLQRAQLEEALKDIAEMVQGAMSGEEKLSIGDRLGFGAVVTGQFRKSNGIGVGDSFELSRLPAKGAIFGK